jgi:site-specific recombinase XerD
VLRFQEKDGKSREIPVRHDLEGYILAYVDAAGIGGEAKDTPLFQASNGRTRALTGKAMSSKRICELVKRRVKDAGLPDDLSPHSFRVTAITDLLNQGVPLEDVQYLAGHAEPRTTGLYDRRQKQVTRNIVERISI